MMNTLGAVVNGLQDRSSPVDRRRQGGNQDENDWKRVFVFDERVDVAYWHIASFRCAAELGHYRGMADIEQAAPIKLDSRFMSMRPAAQAMCQQNLTAMGCSFPMSTRAVCFVYRHERADNP